MPFESFEVVSYAVSLIAGDAEREAVARPVVTIHIVPREGAVKRADVYLRFYRPGATVPGNRRTVHPDGSVMYMASMLLEQYPNAVDLLRNEKPLFFYYDVAAETAYLSTTPEPVGEGDPDADYLRSIGREP